MKGTSGDEKALVAYIRDADERDFCILGFGTG